MDETEITLNIWEVQGAKNVADLLDEETIKQIGFDAYEGYSTDKASRKEWEDRMDKGIKLALQMVEEKNSPWHGASNVKFPLVTIAALQFSARALPALVKAPDIVKYRISGSDQNGDKAARAQRIGQHMSYQLLNEDEEWEEDFDKALIALPIIGTTFKKSYFDPVEGHNVSKHVLATNLVVSYYTRTLEKCERKTEEFELSMREIKERQNRGIFRQVELVGSPTTSEDNNKTRDKRQGLTEPTSDKKRSRKLLEQHTYLDLDGDGYEEPYVVTLDKATKEVLRIVSRFEKVETEQSIQIEALRDEIVRVSLQMQDVMRQVPQRQGNPTPEQRQMLAEAEQAIMALTQKKNMLAQQVQQLEQSNQAEPQVVQIRAIEYYTKYGFIPSPDGGFYDLGLGALLGPLNDSVDTLINQLIDSGTLNNGNHGFIARGGRIPGGKVQFDEPFEWKQVNTGGKTLRESLVPLPVNQPSPVLFNLLSLLISYSEKVSSVNEAMTGSNVGQNTPAYSYHAMLEQGLQVFNGIFKRIYRSFRKEIRKLYLLNARYLNDVEYFEWEDSPQQVLRNDYTADPKDCVPASDPNAFSNQESQMKAHFLAERSSMVPGYNTARVELLLLEAMDIPNRQEIFPLDEQGNPVIQPPVNPEIEIKSADMQSRILERKSRQETNSALAESTMDKDFSQVMLNLAKAKELGDKSVIEEHRAITERMKVRMDAMKDEQRKAQSQSDS